VGGIPRWVRGSKETALGGVATHTIPGTSILSRWRGQLMTSKVRVPSTALALGGWKGTLDVDGDVLRVVSEDPSNRLDIDGAQIKRCSFNRNNGLRAFRMKDGKKVYLQPQG
jgi:hypothetical protein